MTVKTTQCPRGEIGRHKGLKTPGIEQDKSLRQSQIVSKHYQYLLFYLTLQFRLEIKANLFVQTSGQTRR